MISVLSTLNVYGYARGEREHCLKRSKIVNIES